MTDSADEILQKLMAKVEQVSPHLVDQWQATAIIESLGYTDRIIQEEFQFLNALALGQHIYERHRATAQPLSSTPAKQPKKDALTEFQIFLTEFSRSFVYAVPLISVLLLEYLPLKQTTQLLPPQLASLFTLAMISSLSTSGGFVQMIQRRGLFYNQLGEMHQVQYICSSFLKLGIGFSILLSFLGTWFGFYRGLFADTYLILANFYYLALSALWMVFAVLSILFPWGTPIALISLTGVFLLLRLVFGVGALEAQILTMNLTLVVVSGIIWYSFRSHKRDKKATPSPPSEPPSTSALVYLLSPYFGYGVFYFAFIFADRITAGSAINPVSGLIFAIDSAYQRSLDLSLLNFLLFVPFVEYFSYIFIRYWYQKAHVMPIDRIEQFSTLLQHCYRRLVLITIACFCALIPMTLFLLKPKDWGGSEIGLTLIGSIGYLLFAIGLLNAIILFSLNQAIAVLKALIPGLMVNLCVGYLLAHWINPSFAVAGLLIGASIFMILASKSILHAIRQPDYIYYLGGY